MNQSRLFVISTFLLFSSFSFSQQNVMNYPTDLPFQTENDSQYYHLDSSLLIRTIVNDILVVVEKAKGQSQNFSILLKSSKGGQLPIEYSVDAQKINSVMASLAKKNDFMKETYDWINRSFRSNIPYRD